ncbi:MAG: sensor histidine kinase [Akkermansiaceae bacterium]
MKSTPLEVRIRLLIICFAALIIMVFSGIGWIILLDSEDEIHDKFFAQAAADIASGKSSATLPEGITAHPDAHFLKNKMQLHEIPTTPGLHDIFANDDLSRSKVIRTFPDRLKLWLSLGYEREFRLWIAPHESTGKIHAVLADLSILEVSEQETERAEKRMLIVSAMLFLVALGVSQLIARWALKPVRVLTRRVLSDPVDVKASPLQKEFPDDEIGQLAYALDDYRERLGQAISRESHFLSDCSHELRTPIATMKSAIDLLDHNQEDVAARERIIGRMRRTSQCMERLVRTFLLLARERRAPESAGVVEVEATVRQVVDEIRMLHPENSLNVSIHSDHEVLLEVDFETLTILCHNLIGNAFHHAGGGILDISIRSEMNFVSLVFQDDGPGFPELHTRTSAVGNGIGLSLVERLCEACQWKFSRGPGPKGGARAEVIIAK